MKEVWWQGLRQAPNTIFFTYTTFCPLCHPSFSSDQSDPSLWDAKFLERDWLMRKAGLVCVRSRPVPGKGGVYLSTPLLHTKLIVSHETNTLFLLWDP